MVGGHAADARCFSARFTRGNLNIIQSTGGRYVHGRIYPRSDCRCRRFLTLFIYDEGEMFLNSRQIKQTAERYRQSS